MANVIFNRVVPKDGSTAKARYEAMTHTAGVFYLVDEDDAGVTPIELYLNDVLLSADAAAEISVEDIAGVFTATNVETVLKELYDAQLAKTIYITEDSTSQEFAKVYSVYQGSEGDASDPVVAEKIADINIPLDLVVKSGSVVDVVFVPGDPTAVPPTDPSLHEGSASGTDVTSFIKGQDTPTEADAGKYIKLIIANNESTPLYIAAKALVDVYTGGETDEATVAIDNSNEITATINKVVATKIIYQEASEAVYEAVPSDGSVPFNSEETYYVYDAINDQYDVEVVADATDYAAKIVSPGLFTQTSPAVSEVNIKEQVDIVEAEVDALADYVGTFDPQPGVNTVIDYIDTKTGEGVGALNGEAEVASVASGVVTLKGGIVETEGIIANSVTDVTGRTKVEGYLYEGNFYSDSSHEHMVDPVKDTEYYEDITVAASPVDYVWTGKAFALVRADITLAKIATTGAAEDASYDNTTSGLTADDTQEAIDEIAARLTWNEV